MLRRMVPAVLALAVGVGTGVVPAGAEGAAYAPPYDDGPSGGGNVTYVDRQDDGTMTIARVYPAPGPLNCPPGGPYAKFEISHTLTGPVDVITASFTDAVLDPYVFVKLGVRAADGTWLGIDEQRGPIIGDGTLTATLDPVLFVGAKRHDPYLAPGDVLTVQFGLEAASACPHAAVGTARFTAVTIRP